MGLFSRKRRSDDPQRLVVWQLSAWCLQYPDDEWRDRLDLLRACAAELGTHPAGAVFEEFLGHLTAAEPRAAEAHYIEVFDTRPRRGLHLTWYVDGDTRRRGASLAELAGMFQQHGMLVHGNELPDHLPSLLEFAVLGGDRVLADATRLFSRFRPGMELLRRNLAAFGTYYTPVLDALLASMPAADNTPAEPPPAEQVGLEPFTLTPGGSR